MKIKRIDPEILNEFVPALMAVLFFVLLFFAFKIFHHLNQFEGEVVIEDFTYNEDLVFYETSFYTPKGKMLIAKTNQGLKVELIPKEPCFYFDGEYKSKDNKLIYSIDLDKRENNKRGDIEGCLKNYVETAQKTLIRNEEEKLQVEAEKNRIKTEIKASWENG